jgi:hypothetical protein
MPGLQQIFQSDRVKTLGRPHHDLPTLQITFCRQTLSATPIWRDLAQAQANTSLIALKFIFNNAAFSLSRQARKHADN